MPTIIRIDPATVFRLVANQFETLATASGGFVRGVEPGDKLPVITPADGASAAGNRPYAILQGVQIRPKPRNSRDVAMADISVSVRVVAPATAVQVAGITSWYSAAGHTAMVLERVTLKENPAGSGSTPNSIGHEIELFDAAYPGELSQLVADDGGGGAACQAYVGDILIMGQVQRDAWGGSSGDHQGGGQETVGGGA